MLSSRVHSEYEQYQRWIGIANILLDRTGAPRGSCRGAQRAKRRQIALGINRNPAKTVENH